ncbi:MAG TPA: hypothetical protein VJG66_02005 [Patescibacteria group bacterium]|nr:hypothetical protein [Patescibacteria group bacterium]
MTSKQFATIVAITFIVGIIWLVSDIIFNTKASIPDNPKLNTLLEPINPNFNPRILNLIGNEIPPQAPTMNRLPTPSVLPETQVPASTQEGTLKP